MYKAQGNNTFSLIAVEGGNKGEYITSQCWTPLVKVRVGPEASELALYEEPEKNGSFLPPGLGLGMS